MQLLFDDLRRIKERKMKIKNRGGFSWLTLFGITGYKRKIARMTGIPFTKGGRQRKAFSGGLLAAIFTLLFD
jgi:hypothetical protein